MRSLFLLLSTAVLGLPSPLAAQQNNWDDYHAGTLRQVVMKEGPGLDSVQAPAGGTISLSAETYPQRVVMTYAGHRRDLTPQARRVIDGFGRGMARDSTYAGRFTHEFEFVEGATHWWLPVQTVLEVGLGKEVPTGRPVTLLTRWFGAAQDKGRPPSMIFVVNEFEAGGVPMPPSQMQLDGFLLGQHVGTVDSALGAPWQSRHLDDGWSQRIYVIDRPHQAYMVFQTDSVHKELAYSVQLAGARGTPMLPFLGLRLGDSRMRVDSLIGPPSRVEREQEAPIDLLTYDGTNYTLEVDSTGVLSSIQIYGYEGFATSPDTSDLDPLPRFEAAVRHWNVDSLLAILAADVEILKGDQAVRWRSSPWRDLSADSSAMARGLRDVARAIDGRHGAMALRHTESGETGLVYKYDQGPIQELFFVWRPGGHRLWEARFR